MDKPHQQDLSDNNIVLCTSNLPEKIHQHNCTYKRRCYRYRSCSACLKIKRRFIGLQALYFKRVWGLNKFLTISLSDSQFIDFKSAFLFGHETKKILSKPLFRKCKYLVVIGVAKNKVNNAFIPHLHILLFGEVEADYLEELLNERFDRDDFSINLQPVVENLSCWKVARYIFKNYTSTMMHNRSKNRVLTASRGFFTGNPKFLPFLSGAKLWD